MATLKKISNQYDFNKIPLVNIVVENKSSAPTSPVNGQHYYDTVALREYVRENGAWVAGSITGAELTANKGVASGYASLDGAIKVPIAQIPTGSTGTTVPFGNDARFSDTRIPTDNTVTGGTPGAGVKIAATTITAANIVNGTLTDVQIAAANKDGAAGTVSLRTLGFGAAQALAGTTRLDQIAAPTAAVSMGTQELTNLGAPLSSSSAARLSDVQAAAAGIDNKPSVRFGESVNRASLTGLTVDGSARTDGDRVILLGQSTGSQNGPWIIHVGAWNRPPNETVTSGAFWLITEGTMASTQWKVATPDPIVLDTTSLSITQWGQGLIYTGTAARVTVTGTVVDIASTYVGQASITTLGTIATGVWNGTAVPVANGGTGATTALAARAALVVPTYYTALLGALTSGAELTVTHNLGTTKTIESFKIIADGTKTDLTVRTVDANNIAVQTDVAGGYGANAIEIVVVGVV